MSQTKPSSNQIENKSTVAGTTLTDAIETLKSGLGATGGGSDKVIFLNQQTITTNYSIPNGMNGLSAGPITVNAGVTVTVPSGSGYVVV